MIDELELLKQDWKKKEAALPKLTYDELYKMIKVKSSSIVKWIFYISVAEFIFWILLDMIPYGEDKLKQTSQFSVYLVYALEVIFYIVLLYFMMRFYLNFKKISSTDSAKDLMKNILSTRKTVATYVWVNLCLFALSMFVVSANIIFNEPSSQLSEKIAEASNPSLVYAIIFGTVVLGTIAFGCLLWLFYRLIYGILLKRLKHNYDELKKLEV